MLQINGKTFMNLQEAVQWLLDNNALPFQSSANYIANTEIGLGTIVNPSPAKVRIGSLIFFADSKVSTVTGLTENGFIVSDQYNDLVDDVAYVADVQVNASGHLITTMSDGQQIDAGILKQVSNFSIDASQHLIAHYNDGTSTDLGAIFSGNVNISGNLTATTIAQSNPNAVYSISYASVPSGCTLTNIYSAFELINGVIHIVCNFKLQNTSESDKTVSLIATGWMYLTDGLASKIVDLDGNLVSQPASDVIITTQHAKFLRGSGVDTTKYDGDMIFYNVNDNKACGIRFTPNSPITLTPNQTIYVTCRVSLVVI